MPRGGNFLHQMLLGDIISSMQTELGDMVRAIAANMQTQAAQGNVIGIMTGGVHVFITAVAGSIIMALWFSCSSCYSLSLTLR